MQSFRDSERTDPSHLALAVAVNRSCGGLQELLREKALREAADPSEKVCLTLHSQQALFLSLRWFCFLPPFLERSILPLQALQI